MALLSIFPFTGALFTLYWAHISGKRKKMAFVVGTKRIARVILFLMAFASKPWVFLVILFFYWFFEYAGTPAYGGIMKDIYPEEHRGKAMGYVRVELALASILSTYLCGMLLDVVSYRLVFPLGAMVGIIAINFFRKIPIKSDESMEFSKERFSPFMIRDVWREDRRFFRYSMIFFLYGFSFLVTVPLYPIFLIDYLQISNAVAGKLASLFSIFWLVSYLFWGEYIDRKSPLKALCIIFGLSAMVPLFYFLAYDLWLVALASAFSGITAGGVELAQLNYLTRIAGKREVQKYWGINYSTMGVRGIIAPFLGVALMKLIGIRWTFFLSFFFIFIAFLLLSILREELESKAKT